MARSLSSREAALRGGLLLCGLLVALGIGELAVRLFPPSWLSMRMNELRAGGDWGTDAAWHVDHKDGAFHRFTPFSELRMRTGEYQVTAHMDALGGRRVAGPAWPAAGGAVLVGDSFAMGVGVEDDETFAALLAKEWQRPMINLGVPGTGLGEQLDLIERRHAELGGPGAYLIAFFTGNDFADIIRHSGSQAGGTRTSRPLGRLNRWFLASPLFRRSYLAQLGRTVAMQLYQKSLTTPDVDPVFPLMLRIPEYVPRAKAALSAQLDRLVTLSRTLRFEPLVVVIPDRHQVDDRLLRERAAYYAFESSKLARRFPTELVLGELAARGVAAIDTTPCLTGLKGAYYVRDNHLTPAGHRAVAACVAREAGAPGGKVK